MENNFKIEDVYNWMELNKDYEKKSFGCKIHKKKTIMLESLYLMLNKIKEINKSKNFFSVVRQVCVDTQEPKDVVIGIKQITIPVSPDYDIILKDDGTYSFQGIIAG